MADERSTWSGGMDTAALKRRVLAIVPVTALLAAACASPMVVISPPGPGVPTIAALEVAPGRIESGCPLAFRIRFEDSGADVVRAVARWRARTGYSRFHEGTEVLPFAPAELYGRSVGRAEVVIVPPHAGNYVYRVQLEDARGQTSNVAEARVYVDIRPFWRRPTCGALRDDAQSMPYSWTPWRWPTPPGQDSTRSATEPPIVAEVRLR
jgi:hypothetical protein